MTDMESFCEEVWFSCNKECAKIILSNSMVKLTAYQRSLLNHVAFSDSLIEYQEEPKTFLEKVEYYLEKIFSFLPF